MGAGAVGGYFGARLAAAGNEVHFIARGPHLEAMRQRGLLVKDPDGDLVVRPARATEDPSKVGEVDLVLFTVKSTGTREAAVAMRPLLGPRTAVLCLQNGVENEDVLTEVVGVGRVIPGVAYVGAEVTEPGVVTHTAMGRIALGERSGEVSERVKEIAKAFEDAGIHASSSTDITTAKWRKLVWNAAFNPITALTGQTVFEALQDDDIKEMANAAMREVIAVAQALGLAVSEDDVPKGENVRSQKAMSKTSMLQDVERGRPTEIEALSGAVVRAGHRVGVPTPINAALRALVKAKEARSRAPAPDG
jgi:2-dehydropantoate 2-reductase